MRVLRAMLPITMLLMSCSSPPQPASVDESTRRPANDPVSVELHTCRATLHNTGIEARESAKLLEQQKIASLRLEAAQRVTAEAASSRAGNSVHTVHFDFGATQAVVPPDVATAMLNSARNAPLILVRGRTDATSDSLADSRVARERAASVRDYLVAAGIPQGRIRTTYQPWGDAVSENSTEIGRRANRRVEVEIYRAMPVQVGGAISQ